MRMRRDEGGAVMAIVAISLIALIGMVVLVVDVGGLLTMRRRMVSASDSAALAAAQQCAGGNGDAAAQAEAESVAKDNVSTASQVSYVYGPEGCGTNATGTVRVSYSADQRLFFAPILGFDKTEDVVTKATALWGPSGTATSVPLMVGTGSFIDDCTIPFATVGAECTFWYDSDTVNGSSTWGWLSLDGPSDGNNKHGWNVAPGDKCDQASASDRKKWITDPPMAPTPLNWPAPTYVCVDSGFADSNWAAISAEIAAGKTLKFFPVNDADGSWSAANGGTGTHGQVDGDGNLDTTGAPDKYDIVGFVALELVALYDGNDPEVQGTPPTAGTPEQTLDCPGAPVKHTFLQGGSDELDLSANIAACEGVVGLPVDESAMEVKGPGIKASDWSYDSSTNVLTWLGAVGKNGQKIEVTLKYTRPATPGTDGSPGACGEHFDGKNQDKCLVAQWAGFIPTVGDPGTGADFGVRAIRLLE